MGVNQRPSALWAYHQFIGACAAACTGNHSTKTWTVKYISGNQKNAATM